ncbi:MAG: transporter substrate-binding domain-containing protein [Deltaproteobacteria bacterium]|nr:transporter substrate-binding domain-containing protein [Deltaproteobacteria bacterium]
MTIAKWAVLPGKPRVGVFLLSLLFSLVMLGSAAAKQVVRVGIYQNAPKVFVDAQGRPAGIFVDLLEEIAARQGWQINYVDGSWAQGLDRLRRGELDLMPDVAKTAQRETEFAFHQEPVLSDWFQIYARSGSGIHSLIDLNAKRVAVLAQSVQEAAFSHLAAGFELRVSLQPFPDYQELFAAVADGRADAAISNRFYGVLHAERHGLADTAIIFHPTRLYFATSPTGDRALLTAIDAELRRLKSDPHSAYFQILQHWISEPRSFLLPGWIKIGGLLLLVLLLLSFGVSLLLKRQVNVRTAELQQSHAVLEQRVATRTAEVAAAMIKAQQADRLKSVFLATMSHELRTPLNSIIGFTGILLQQLAGPLNGEQQTQLGMVQTSARHLLSLINDVLDLSKIEAGQLELAPSTFDLSAVLQKLLKLVTPQLEKKGLELHVEIAADVGEINTDQRRLEQIVINLLSNAIKFTDEGWVRLSCRRAGGDCLISVADTGIGIAADKRDEAFQPFHQLDNGLTRRHEGTGLGLAICHKLAAALGGSIAVESEPGHGSLFTLRFPYKRQELS